MIQSYKTNERGRHQYNKEAALRNLFYIKEQVGFHLTVQLNPEIKMWNDNAVSSSDMNGSDSYWSLKSNQFPVITTNAAEENAEWRWAVWEASGE